MKFNTWCVFVIIIALVIPVGGQGTRITGRVLDGLTGRPIAGASVWSSGLKKSVRTDADGRFKFSTISNLTFTGPLISQGNIFFQVNDPSSSVEVNLRDLRGRSLFCASRRFEAPGRQFIPLQGKFAHDFVGFLSISSESERYDFRIAFVRGRAVSQIPASRALPSGLAKTAFGDTVFVAFAGKKSKKLYSSSAVGDIGDIVLENIADPYSSRPPGSNSYLMRAAKAYARAQRLKAETAR